LAKQEAKIEWFHFFGTRCTTWRNAFCTLLLLDWVLRRRPRCYAIWYDTWCLVCAAKLTGIQLN